MPTVAVAVQMPTVAVTKFLLFEIGAYISFQPVQIFHYNFIFKWDWYSLVVGKL
jgi:hypothetical protein